MCAYGGNCLPGRLLQTWLNYLRQSGTDVRKLEEAGLVRREVRGREHLLSLNAAPLSEAAAWIAHYQRFWEDSLAALDQFVTGRKTKQRKPK